MYCYLFWTNNARVWLNFNGIIHIIILRSISILAIVSHSHLLTSSFHLSICPVLFYKIKPLLLGSYDPGMSKKISLEWYNWCNFLTGGSLANPRKNSRLIFSWLMVSTVSYICNKETRLQHCNMAIAWMGEQVWHSGNWTIVSEPRTVAGSLRMPASWTLLWVNLYLVTWLRFLRFSQ